jgi:hypothetical protein
MIKMSMLEEQILRIISNLLMMQTSLLSQSLLLIGSLARDGPPTISPMTMTSGETAPVHLAAFELAFSFAFCSSCSTSSSIRLKLLEP